MSRNDPTTGRPTPAPGENPTRWTWSDLFSHPGTGPLAGVVVADLTRILAGPYCTMLLADMGALVIKVESPAGDDTRTWSPPARDGEATYFLSVNRNKYSIALDFTDPHDLATAKEIVARSDVLVENFKTASLTAFELDYENVSRWQPSLVYASITGFGTAGGADLPGYDLIAQALSGMMDLTGSADGEPTKLGVALVDVVTGLHAAVGVLAALQSRKSTGRGDHVQVNLLSSALSSLVNHSAASVAGGASPTRMGNAHTSLYPYEPFPTKDKQLVVAAGNDAQFQRLCHALELPNLAHDSRFTSMPDRNHNRAQLRAVLSDRLRSRTAEEWFQLLRRAQVPVAPILDVSDGIGLAQELGLAPIIETGVGDRCIPTIRNPIDFSSVTLDYSQAPPLLDADRIAIESWLAL